jgi:hypothetical protein
MNELLQTVATKGGPLTSRHCGGMSEGLSALGVASAAISPSRLMNSEGLTGPVNTPARLPDFTHHDSVNPTNCGQSGQRFGMRRRPIIVKTGKRKD